MGSEPLAVTWGVEPTPAIVAEVQQVATRWNLPLYERPRKHNLTRQLGVFADAFLVLSGKGWRLEDREGALKVSPGLAMLRRKRLVDAAAIPDRLLRHAELRRGETIVDATLGLGADARLLATGVGREGTVFGLEASLPLAVLLAEGLRRESWPDTAPIEVHHTRAVTWLARRPAKSVDVVFFDPMFERAKTSSVAFAQVRRFAVHEPLTRETIDAARRVARRLVLMKGSDPREFPLLGLEPVPPESNSTIYWGTAGPS